MNYQYHYNKLIDRAPKTKPATGYYERHRIVPGCMGGKYVSGNIAWLTPEEHYVAHQLLVKIHKETEWYAKLLRAATKMRQGRNNKLYGWLRRKLAKLMSERIVSEETKQKISRTRKELFKTGKLKPVITNHSEEVKRQVAERNRKRTGWKHKQETRKQQSHSAKGKNNWSNGRIWCHNPLNISEQKMIKNSEELPTHWVFGRPFQKRNRC